jgi:hypothetical protein
MAFNPRATTGKIPTPPILRMAMSQILDDLVFFVQWDDQ